MQLCLFPARRRRLETLSVQRRDVCPACASCAVCTFDFQTLQAGFLGTHLAERIWSSLLHLLEFILGLSRAVTFLIGSSAVAPRSCQDPSKPNRNSKDRRSFNPFAISSHLSAGDALHIQCLQLFVVGPALCSCWQARIILPCSVLSKSDNTINSEWSLHTSDRGLWRRSRGQTLA